VEPDDHLVVGEGSIELPLDEADQDRPAGTELPLEVGDLSADEIGRQIAPPGDVAESAGLEARWPHRAQLGQDAGGPLGGPVGHQHRDRGSAAIDLRLLSDQRHVAHGEPASLSLELHRVERSRRAGVGRDRHAPRGGGEEADQERAHS